jgi:hypothetical protein
MDGKTHHLMGGVSSIVYAGFSVRHDDAAFFWKILAGAVGGHIGSRLPDILEPATSSHEKNG